MGSLSTLNKVIGGLDFAEKNYNVTINGIVAGAVEHNQLVKFSSIFEKRGIELKMVFAESYLGLVIDVGGMEIE